MLRVLVVEDEEMSGMGIVLATDWLCLGCVVVGEAANGEEGILQAEACKPSLIITDLKMPKMDGLEMISRLREAGCEAYVIILTAYDSFTYAQTAIRLGAVDFLLKPFHDGDLENGGLRCQDCSGRGPGENVWKKPDVVAPGTQIISCQAAYGKYVARSGTSMATPIVSGLLALAWEKYPYLNAMQLKRKLILSATDLGESYLLQGAGMVDVEKMLS